LAQAPPHPLLDRNCSAASARTRTSFVAMAASDGAAAVAASEAAPAPAGASVAVEGHGWDEMRTAGEAPELPAAYGAPHQSPSSDSTVLARKVSLTSRAGSSLHRAGSTLQRAASSVQLQRASSLPLEDDDLRYAASMPGLMDVEADRPFCFGLWKTQQLVGFILGVLILVVFLSVKVVKTYNKADAMIAVAGLTACFWIFEVMPIYVTALLPVVLMPLFSITSTQIAAAAYWNWVSMLFLGAFMVDVAMEHASLPRTLLLWLLRKTGVARAWVVLAIFMAVAWLLSMVCSDVAVTLMLAPFATGLLNAAEEEAMDAAAASLELGVRAGERTDEEANLKAVSRFGAGLSLGIAYAASAGGLATTVGTPANALLVGQEILGGAISFDKWFAFALPISACVVIVAYVILYFMYARGVQLPISHETLAEQEGGVEGGTGRVSSDEVLVGGIAGLLIVLLCFQPLIDRFVTNPLGEPLSGSATTACLCACLLFLLPSSLRPGEALLTWRVAQERVPWGVLLLIGGGFSLAKGFESSGLDVVLGSAVGGVVHKVTPLGLHFFIVFTVTLLIQLMNSIATAAWVLPVLAAASQHSVMNPLELLLPATVACSLSFLLPTASPSNAVIFGKSRDLSKPLRIRDFVRAGLPLTLAAAAFAALMSFGLSRVVFDAGAPFPRAMCEARQVNCVWVYVPGVVQGRHVDGQACMPLDESDGEVCKLWSGNVLNIADVPSNLQPGDAGPALAGASYGGPAPEPEAEAASSEEPAAEPVPTP